MFTLVLDDDPTGTQSATGVTVLLRWDAAAITEVLRADGAVYLQTNSRAVPAEEAAALARGVRDQLAVVEQQLGEPVLVVLRGDSTLRGHVFAETDVFARPGAGPRGVDAGLGAGPRGVDAGVGAGERGGVDAEGGARGRVGADERRGVDARDGGTAGAPVLFVPGFPQGGRTTIDSVHRVVIDGVDRPVADTEFARDPVFGYRSSNLVDWVREQGGRRAIPVPLDRLRASAGRAVADALGAAGPGEFVVPDVRDDADIELIHAGLLEAVGSGIRTVVRCAAPLAAVCAGRPSRGLLARPLAGTAGRPVLVVCGSHTAAATEQLERLEQHLGSRAVVIPTDDAFADPDAAGRRAAAIARPELHRTGTVIVSTERRRRAADDTLAHGETVMRALMAATAALLGEVGTVVSKGGITSAEVARLGFGASRAVVRGQVAAGISVWDLAGSGGAGVQVVVPGNVGGRETLVDVLSALGRGEGKVGEEEQSCG